MEKACIQNLALIITEDCNLNCRHCMRGKKCQKVMSNEVIEATLKQCKYIRNLCICGGEPLMNLEPLFHIIDCLLKYDIRVDEISYTINGTIYKEGFISLLKKINDKLKDGSTIAISYDVYHIEEIKKRNLKEAYIENVKRYAETPYFIGLKRYNHKLRLFNEGNARLLDPNLTVDLKPVDYAMTYVNHNKHKLDLSGYCYIGPIVSISVDGYITECDASFENQRTKFNYGNVLVDSIIEVIKTKTPIVTPRKYNHKVRKIIYDFHHYNK